MDCCLTVQVLSGAGGNNSVVEVGVGVCELSTADGDRLLASPPGPQLVGGSIFVLFFPGRSFLLAHSAPQLWLSCLLLRCNVHRVEEVH